MPPMEVDVDVLAAVNKLSVQQRASVVLTYWEDLTPAQIASRLGISEGSVKRHLARARARLRELLDD
jgi:RNA polymerase sigma-70 factor (ECF subfamily)